MLREARAPKVHDWLVNYVVKKSPHAEELRVAWSADPDPVVASAGWALTTERVAKKPEGLDLAGLLDVIEAEMKDAPDRLQWAMNHCLAQIGIEHAAHRARALDIGERLGVLKDYPTPPNCTSPVRARLDHRDGPPPATPDGAGCRSCGSPASWLRVTASQPATAQPGRVRGPVVTPKPWTARRSSTGPGRSRSRTRSAQPASSSAIAAPRGAASAQPGRVQGAACSHTFRRASRRKGGRPAGWPER